MAHSSKDDCISELMSHLQVLKGWDQNLWRGLLMSLNHRLFGNRLFGYRITKMGLICIDILPLQAYKNAWGGEL